MHSYSRTVINKHEIDESLSLMLLLNDTVLLMTPYTHVYLHWLEDEQRDLVELHKLNRCRTHHVLRDTRKEREGSTQCKGKHGVLPLSKNIWRYLTFYLDLKYNCLGILRKINWLPFLR